MLSRDEEHELSLLEESLRETRWQRFELAVEGPVWRHRWKVRSALAFGVLVWVCGGITGDDGLVSEGFFLTNLVAGYWWVMFMRQRTGPPPGGDRPPRPRPGAR